MYSTDKTQSRPGSRQFEIFQNPSPNKKFSIVFMFFIFLILNTNIKFDKEPRNINLYHNLVGFYGIWRGNSGSKIDGGLADLSIR